MLQRLNKIIHFFAGGLHKSRSKGIFRKKPSGQIAVILILVTAMMIIFWVVLLNLGRIAQMKTVVTIASNMSAAFMASEMASFAEYQYQAVLGGADKTDDGLSVCGWTGVAAAVLAIVILVIGIITGLWHAGIYFAIALILAVLTLGIELMVIEPGMSDLFQKKLAMLSQEDSFVERGISAGFQNSVSDTVQIKDRFDSDMDGLWNDQDKVSRFGSFYQDRLSRLLNHPDALLQTIKNFKVVLGDFVHRNPYVYKDDAGNDVTVDNGWGLWDPAMDTCGLPPPALIHPCCFKGSSPIPECNPCCQPDRPACCGAAVHSCGDMTSCPTMDFPYYDKDKLYENDTNGLTSFREFLGHDDENRYRYNNETQHESTAQFRAEDATGIYSLFWKVVARAKIEEGASGQSTCFWCDAHKVGCENTAGMVLPNTCSNNNCCLYPGSDLIGNAQGGMADGECYNDSGDLWKKGAVKYCSNAPPFSCSSASCDPGCQSCQKDNSCPTCQTTASTDKSPWAQDLVDEDRYKLDVFLKWADKILKTDAEDLKRTFSTWYPEAEEWLLDYDDAVTGQHHKSWLSDWKDLLETWRLRLNEWHSSVDLYFSPQCPVGENIFDCYRDRINAFQSCYDNCDQDHCRTAALSNDSAPSWPGSCTAGFHDQILNDITKRTVRRDFLQSAYTQITTAAAELLTAVTNIQSFVADSNVTALKTQWDLLHDANIKPPAFSIYVWQDEKPFCGPKNAARGCWHAVRVDAAIPGRCGRKCGRNGIPEPYQWPHVKEFKAWGGMRRCYALGDSFGYPGCEYEHWNEDDHAKNCFTGGTVKSRIIRYDEDKDIMLKFANALPIWQFLSSHPNAPKMEISTQDMIGNMVNACITTACPNGQCPEERGAFMLSNDSGGGCPGQVANLLVRGVQSKTCAEYFFRQNSDKGKNGFFIKFVPCTEPFL